MAGDVVWRPQARDDLLDMYAFVARTNPAAADRLYDRLREKTTLLATQPRIGQRRPDIRPSVRIPVERPFLILYETHPDTDHGAIDRVEIVRVVHGRRELTRLF